MHTILTELSDVGTPAPSLNDSRGSVDMTATTPSTPVDTLFDYPATIKEEEEPSQSTFPINTLPPAFDNLSTKPAPSPSPLPQTLDPTQHSAAMLCDLQCRSSLRARSTRQQQQQQQQQAQHSTSTSWWWTTLFLYLMHLQLQGGYKALLLALWTHSPSRMTQRLMQASTRRSTSPSTTSSTTTTTTSPRLSRSTRALAQRNAATAPVSTALQRSMSSSSSSGEVQRARARAVVEQLCRTYFGVMALWELDGERGTRNREGKGGVGR